MRMSPYYDSCAYDTPAKKGEKADDLTIGVVEVTITKPTFTKPGKAGLENPPQQQGLREAVLQANDNPILPGKFTQLLNALGKSTTDQERWDFFADQNRKAQAKEKVQKVRAAVPRPPYAIQGSLVVSITPPKPGQGQMPVDIEALKFGFVQIGSISGSASYILNKKVIGDRVWTISPNANRFNDWGNPMQVAYFPYYGRTPNFLKGWWAVKKGETSKTLEFNDSPSINFPNNYDIPGRNNANAVLDKGKVVDSFRLYMVASTIAGGGFIDKPTQTDSKWQFFSQGSITWQASFVWPVIKQSIVTIGTWSPAKSIYAVNDVFDVPGSIYANFPYATWVPRPK
jgi:hypothetical protein